MTPDQTFQALVPGVQLFFTNRGYGAVMKLIGDKLRITVQRSGQAQVTKDFACPRDNAGLLVELEAWVEELDGVSE